jgi:3-deoxy-D-manno-octulosonic-acid transferase
MFNFAAVVSALAEAGGIEQVSGTDDLVQAVSRLLADQPRQQAAGAAAAKVVASHRGATERVMRVLETMLGNRD